MTIKIETQGDFSDLKFGDVVESAQPVPGSINFRFRGTVANKPPANKPGQPLDYVIVLSAEGVASLVTNREAIRKVVSVPNLDLIVEGHEVPEKRLESLKLALELGADAKTLETLRDAGRLSRKNTIVLPRGRFEHLSRGRGWARMGRGDNVTWGEKEDNGHRVGPGRWTVGSTDGFSRKSSTDWKVSHVQVGDQTWTIAN